MKRAEKVKLVAVISLVVLLAGCVISNGSAPTSVAATTSTPPDIEKLEVLHFHGANQCASCIAVGKFAEETVSTYYSDELRSGRIFFAHINGELAENKEITAKYGATGSSLWIGTYLKNGTFKAEQNTNVWYKIDNKTAYMSYLKGIIDANLGKV